MFLTTGIEVTAGAFRFRIAAVAFFMNVPALEPRRMAAHHALNANLFSHLSEGHIAAHVRAASRLQFRRGGRPGGHSGTCRKHYRAGCDSQ